MMDDDGSTIERAGQRTRSRQPQLVRSQVYVDDIIMDLRTRLGVPLAEAVPGEEAALMGHLPASPTIVANVDCGAWLAWTLAGLSLFSMEKTPTLRVVVGEARRIMLALAMLRHRGNITRVAASLGISRRVSRDYLKAAGLYVPPGLPVRERSTPSDATVGDGDDGA